MIALSQLNRAVESREDKKPRMADLRESGAIEQDADIVLLLHRPDYYEPTDQPGIAELIIAKNRNGATGSLKLAFVKKIARFENLATLQEPMDEGGSPFEALGQRRDSLSRPFSVGLIHPGRGSGSSAMRSARAARTLPGSSRRPRSGRSSSAATS